MKNEFKRALDIEYWILLVENQRGVEGIIFEANPFKTLSKSGKKSKYLTFIKHRQYERGKAGAKPFDIHYCHKAETGELILKLIKQFVIEKIDEPHPEI